MDVLAELVGSIGSVGYGLAAIGPGIGVGIVWAAYIPATPPPPPSAGLTPTHPPPARVRRPDPYLRLPRRRALRGPGAHRPGRPLHLRPGHPLIRRHPHLRQ